MIKYEIPEVYGNLDEQDRDRLCLSLEENKALREYMKARNLPSEEIRLHPYRIVNVLKKKQICSQCSGLSMCMQKEKGYVEELIYNDYLDTQLEACQYKEEQLRNDSHLVNYLVNDMGRELRQAFFNRIQLQNETAEYQRILRDIINAAKGGQGIYLYGNFGTGKSYLAACASNLWAKEGKAVAFVHCSKFADRIASGFVNGEYQQEIRRLCYADFVVFDDIGAENVTERNRSLLLSILDDRMQNQRVTWFTSNEDHESLLHHFISTSRGDDYTEAKRLLERIQALAKPVKLVGKDRRTLYHM